MVIQDVYLSWDGTHHMYDYCKYRQHKGKIVPHLPT